MDTTGGGVVRLFHVHFPGRTLVLALSDGLLCALALVAATYVWLGSNADLELRYEHGVLRVLFASLVCVLCMYYNDLYDSLVLRSLRDVIVRMIRVLGAVCIVLAVIYYGFPSVQIGRGPLIVWVFLAGLALLGAIEDLPDIVSGEKVERVIVSMGERRGRLPVEELLALKTRGVLIE